LAEVQVPAVARGRAVDRDPEVAKALDLAADLTEEVVPDSVADQADAVLEEAVVEMDQDAVEMDQDAVEMDQVAVEMDQVAVEMDQVEVDSEGDAAVEWVQGGPTLAIRSQVGVIKTKSQSSGRRTCLIV
jgi:hypothetical protein